MSIFWGSLRLFRNLVLELLILTCSIIFPDNVSYCDFLAVRFESTYDMPPMRQGWIYPTNSMLQPIFDQFMAEVLITGVFDRINTNLRPAHPTCQADGMVPIDINFVAILFILLAIGVIIAILLFILENFGFNCDIFKTNDNEIPKCLCRCHLNHH